MFPWYQLIFTVAVIALIYYLISNAFKASDHGNGLPPMRSGWLPWLGCAIEFGKSPLTFIEEMRRQLGPVFTLKVAGERMTFLTEPSDFHYFFRSSNVDFQKAVQDAVQNVGSLTADAFFQSHTKMHDTVKGRLAAANLPAMCQNLFTEFKKHLSEVKLQNDLGEAVEKDLNKLVRSTMYKSVMNNLFGNGILPTENEEAFKEMEKNFVTFDDQFEYGARLPTIFIREWASAKQWLLSLFSKAFTQMMKDIPKDTAKQTLAQTVLSMVDREFAPNWGMMLLWASLANAIPITFWTLALIYSHPHVLAKVQAEVDAILKHEEEISEATLAAMPYTKQCTLEAIRLRSPGIITRRVVKEFTARGFTVPSGDLLMVSPHWAHRNPKCFPEPDTFKPERWDKLDKNSFPEEFIAFGGGRYQCPGRWFALMEIHMYVGMFVNKFDCELLSGVPDLCKLYLVGTQQPVQNCPVILSRRRVEC